MYIYLLTFYEAVIVTCFAQGHKLSLPGFEPTICCWQQRSLGLMNYKRLVLKTRYSFVCCKSLATFGNYCQRPIFSLCIKTYIKHTSAKTYTELVIESAKEYERKNIIIAQINLCASKCIESVKLPLSQKLQTKTFVTTMCYLSSALNCSLLLNKFLCWQLFWEITNIVQCL